MLITMLITMLTAMLTTTLTTTLTATLTATLAAAFNILPYRLSADFSKLSGFLLIQVLIVSSERFISGGGY